MGKSTTDKSKQVRSVFIVDDHPVLREGLTQLINREDDLEVCGEAEDISTALEAIALKKPDIVTADLTLETDSGFRLIENISYSYPRLPVIVLSMHDESIYAERCLKAGAKGYIMKHEPSTKLLSALRKVLDGEIYVSDNLSRLLLNKFVAGESKVANSAIDLLSSRQLEVYQLMGKGLKKREISEQLKLSVKTVETYVDHIKQKLQFKDTHEVFVNAFKFVNEGITQADRPKAEG